MVAILYMLLLAHVPATAIAPASASAPAATAPTAQQGEMAVAVSALPKTVPITLGYSGAAVRVFGVLPKDADGVVLVMRPQEDEKLRLVRKARVVLFWMSTKQYDVSLPNTYQVISSAKLDDLLTPEQQLAHGIGYASLRDRIDSAKQLKGEKKEGDPDVLFKGTIQLKEKQGLFKVGQGVTVEAGKLFHAELHLPDKVRAGKYSIEAYATKDKRVVGRASAALHLELEGLLAWLEMMAWKHEVLYGIMAVVIALAAGLLVGMLFKKGGGH